MDTFLNRRRRQQLVILQPVLVGIGVNVLLAFITNYFKLPVYWDTIGTMFVSSLVGFFPGILVAVVTNLICSIFNDNAAFFSIINVLIAMVTVWYNRKGLYRDIKKSAIFVAIIGVGSGILSAIIQWLILGEPENESIRAIIDSMSISEGFGGFMAFTGLNIILNLLDKGMCFVVVAVALHFMPDYIKERIHNSAWMQSPLTKSQEESIESWNSNTRRSARKRMTVVVTVIALTATLITAYLGLHQYLEAAREDKTNNAVNASKFAASVVDPSKIDEYIRDGEAAPGYKDTEDMLYKIRDNASGIAYLYIVKVERDKVTFVFDLDANQNTVSYAEVDDTEGEEPGTVVPVDEEFEEYMDDMQAGKVIPPIESTGAWSWLVSSYYPILDSSGHVVAYAGADASLDYLYEYMAGFARRLILVLLGIIAAIVSYGIWMTNYYTVYPIESLGVYVRRLTEAGDDQEELDAVVRQMRTIDIRTDDEIENLYHDLCDMALNQTEKLRSIRRLSENTVQMQDGLIITMADLVENRDADTGAHIQKTAAYVNIIVRGLKEKGYYAEKITPKFMSDVVRSAPLHDVGKINIPDNVLNKPGKLTDEEYEIMKTHTTAGMKIMEKAIDTVGGENYLKEARNMAAYHHERWDGKGYPEGLHGEVIPLSARIMAVADVFDALTSPRVYKPPFPLEKALAIIEEGKGTQFDEKCVEVFMDSLDEVKVILRKYHNEYYKENDIDI